MSKESLSRSTYFAWLAAFGIALPGLSVAQVPVDESGEPIPVTETGSNEIPLLQASELEELVGPIALRV